MNNHINTDSKDKLEIYYDSEKRNINEILNTSAIAWKVEEE